MASLQDQLLKAGMVNAQKVKQVKKEKRKQSKRVRHGEAEPVDEVKQAARQAQLDKAERDREINRQNQLLAEQKAIAAQIKQLVETHRLDRQGGEVGFQFVDGKSIKKLYVTAAQQRQLELGQAAIVAFNGDYELVATAIAEKIRQRDDGMVVLLNERTEPAHGDDDDPYADYVVPDDLMW